MKTNLKYTLCTHTLSEYKTFMYEMRPACKLHQQRTIQNMYMTKSVYLSFDLIITILTVSMTST